ncbi:MAG: helix-turn-helix domain-containing protein [Eubacterium sp.]
MNLETGKRLYEYRKLNGFSQEELAEKLGVSRQTISKWERAESSPDTDNLIALSKLYGITIDELVNIGEAPKKTYYTPDDTENEADDDNSNGKKTDVSFKNGIHVHDGKDNVDIDFTGIHVESKNGDSVHIGGDCGVNVKTGKPPKNPLFNILIPIAAVIFYLLVGFTLDRGWAIGWIVFLFIPIINTAYTAIVTKNPSHFSYPVLATVIFLLFGMICGVWHPTWIIFITIPVYYALCDAVKKSRRENQSGEATYYSPDAIDAIDEKPKNNTLPKILTAVLSVVFVLIIGLICIISLYSANTKSNTGIALSKLVDYDNGDEYAVGGAFLDPDSFDNIYIDWVDGDVDIEYYNAEQISVSETEMKNEDYQLRYCVKNNELRIEYCKSGLRIGPNKDKNLTVRIPKDKAFYNVDIISVSADVNVDGLVVENIMNFENVSGKIDALGSFNSIYLNNVSGDVAITGIRELNSFKADTVSGDCKITLPANTTGFTVNYNTVSGDISAESFDGYESEKFGSHSHVYNDGSTNIEFDSVSGDLEIEKQN